MIDVLIVEDNPNDVRLIVHALNGFKVSSGLDFNIRIQTDGALALDYIFKDGAYELSNHAIPKLILLDLSLPSIDGFSIIEQVRCVDSMKSLPIIILTGDESEDSEKICMDLKADEYISKSNVNGAFNQRLCSSLIGWLKPLASDCSNGK